MSATHIGRRSFVAAAACTIAACGLGDKNDKNERNGNNGKDKPGERRRTRPRGRGLTQRGIN